jgi:DNA-binding beta-propeller fold protein YncE
VLRLVGLLALAIAALLALTAFLAVAVTPALAARGHEFDPSLMIGTPCTTEPCGPGELKEPTAVAVNEASGDVYVLDQGNNRVQRFSSIGASA